LENVRSHGTTGETPIVRLARDEAHRLKPLGGRPLFGSLRELIRIVGNDCPFENDTNNSSVLWRLIGERVAVRVSAGEVRIRHGTREVAVHKVLSADPRSRLRRCRRRLRRPYCCVLLPDTKQRLETTSLV
jgi:hypothetical protein